MKGVLRALSVLAAAACMGIGLSVFGRTAEAEAKSGMKDSGLNYAESTENFVNPERGFYQALSVTIPADTETAWWTQSFFAGYTNTFGVLHLRLGLENFSSAAGGRDGPISEAALVALSATLDNLRKAGGTAIVRFSYNVNGLTSNGKYLENEPSMERIEEHIAQLGGVLAENADVVTAVETGMLGPWGEQHSTALAGSGAETYYRLVEAWLKIIPESRTVSVRRPLYYIYWANMKYGKSLTTDTLSEDVSAEGTDAYRVGVYNDGYLGSSSDLGTFTNRGEETAWLSAQAAHTLYGGEVVADSETGLLGSYNDADYLEREAFVTHTSYLNIAWNDQVISAWQRSAYDGADSLYAGKSDYDYIAAHLGYRLVLRKSELSASVSPGGVLRLAGEIENVGFGNVVNRKNVQLILASETEKYVCSVAWDVRDTVSREVCGYDWRFRLPSDAAPGNYAVYIRIRDAEEKTLSTVRSIRFANEDIFVASLGANKLGEIVVSGASEGSYSELSQIGGGSFEPSEFTLFFAANGGTENIPDSIRAKAGAYVTLPDVQPGRKGHVFVGWSDGEKIYGAGERYCLLQNVTLEAQWERGGCLVKFDGDGGILVSGSEEQSVLYGDAAEPPVYEKTGHVFAGWSVDPSKIEGDVTIAAVWTAEVYTVRFLSREEAVLTEGSATQEIGYGASAVPPVYTREGYRLVGWEGDYESITGHGVFYAVWEKEASEKTNGGCKGALPGFPLFAVTAAPAFAFSGNRRRNV